MLVNVEDTGSGQIGPCCKVITTRPMNTYIPNDLAPFILICWERGIYIVLYIKVRGIITRPPIYKVWIDMSMVT